MSWGDFEGEPAFDDAFTFDHDWLLFDGLIPDQGSPFIVEVGPTKFMSNSVLATLMGVPVAVVIAERTGVPYWRLERAARAFAEFLNVDLSELRAAIQAKKNEIWGRKNGLGSFPSLVDSGLQD